MKKILTMLTLVTVLSIPAVSTYASSTNPDEIKSGSVEVTTNGISPYETEDVGGGTWSYGFTGSKVYSQYDHGGAEHKSSVKNNNAGSLTSSDWKNPGVTAYASIEATLWGNQSYRNKR